MEERMAEEIDEDEEADEAKVAGADIDMLFTAADDVEDDTVAAE